MTLKDAIIQHFITQAIVDWVKRTRKDKGAMNFLSGYKTYIIIALLVVLNVLHYLGVNVPGFTAINDPGNLIGVVLGLWSARSGAKDDAAKAVVISNGGTVATAKTAIKEVNTGL